MRERINTVMFEEADCSLGVTYCSTFGTISFVKGGVMLMMYL